MQFAVAAAVSKEDVERILGQIPLALCALEVPSLRIVAANQAYASLVAASGAEELVGTIPSDEGRCGLEADLLPLFREAVAHGGVLSPREVEASRNGETRCFEVRCDPLAGRGAGAAAMVAVVCDITAQRQAERALRDKEYQYRTLFESNPHPMWVYDLETLAFLAVNDAAIQQYGYSREEFLSMTIKDIRPPEDVPALLENVRGVTSGLDIAGVWRHCRKGGEVFFVEIVSHTITFQGRPAEVVLALDVTERREAEEHLRETTSELNAVFQALPDLYFRLDAGGAILDYRAGRESDLYVPPAEFLGKRMQDVLPPDVGRKLGEGIARVSQEGRPTAVEYALPCPEGAKSFEARLVPFSDRQVIAVIRDITERREAEKRLRTSETNYRSIFDAVDDAIFVHDTETGRILDVNRKMREMYGYTTEETRSLTVGDLSANEEPYTLDKALECVHRAAIGESQLFEWLAKDKEGRRFWVEVSLKRASIGGEGRLLAVVRDITERKRAIQELEAAHQRVLRGEEERKRFYREVIRAVTNDKLHLVDAEEVPTAGNPALTVPLDQPANYACLRRELREIAEGAGMAADVASDLLLAVGEAATNAIKHATGSESTIYVAPDRVIVRVSDHGSGIQAEDLPGAILLPGFSTRISLGMGYTIMLQLADRVWLATSTRGTVVQLEKWIHPDEHPQPTLAAAWEKL